MESYDLSPAPTVIELDTRSDGSVIQAILGRITGRSTVPNVILQVRIIGPSQRVILANADAQASSIGGSDDISLLDEQNKLKEMLEASGVKVLAIKE